MSNFGLKNWMQDPAIQSKTLYQITVPATHDSGAYELGWELTTDSHCGTDMFGSYGDLFALLVGIASGTTVVRVPILLPLQVAVLALGTGAQAYVKGLAQSQTLTLKEQLENGIRALDLRVCADSSGTLRTAHSLVGNKIDDLLNDVKSFLDEPEASHELVILDLGVGSTTETGNCRNDLKSMVKQKFGTKIIPNDGSINLLTTPIAALTANGSRVLVTISDSNDQDNYFWPDFYKGAPGSDTWGNAAAYVLSQIETAQENFLKTTSSTSLNNVNWTLTPNQNYILESLINASLHNLSKVINPEIRNFLSCDLTVSEQEKIRRIGCDFFNESDVVAVAISLSRGEMLIPPPSNRIFGTWQTNQAMSLAALNNKLYLTFVGTDKSTWIASSADGINWPQQPTRIFGTWQTNQAMYLAEFNGKLYLTFVGTSGGDTWIASSVDGINWPQQPTRIFGTWQTSKAMCLAAFNKKLYLTFVGTSGGDTWIASSVDGINWPQQPTRIFGTWQTSKAMCLAAFNKKLYLTFVGTDNSTWIASSGDGVTWPQQPTRIFGTWQTNQAMSLAALNNKLYLTFVGTDNSTWIASSDDGVTWPQQPTRIFGTWQTNQAMSLAALNNKLYLTFVGTDKSTWIDKIDIT